MWISIVQTTDSKPNNQIYKIKAFIYEAYFEKIIVE